MAIKKQKNISINDYVGVENSFMTEKWWQWVSSLSLYEWSTTTCLMAYNLK